MNLSTMESTIKLLIRSDAPDFLNNRKLWINETQRIVCGLEPWFFTEKDETYSTSLQTFTLANSYARIAALWRTSGADSPLELVTIDIGSQNLLAASGAPTHYRSPAHNQVVHVPTPDVSYSFRLAGHVYLADFSLAGDENVLSIISPYTLIFGACIEASIHLGRDPSLWKARFEETLAILRDNHSKRGRSLG